MRILIRGLVAASVLGAVLLAPGCKKKRHADPTATIEEESGLESSISVADPAASSQILHGFHAVEGNAWRWSMKTFAVSLSPPAVAAGSGAVLEMDFAMPEAVASRLKEVSIQATIDGKPLPAFRTATQGNQTYRQAVPAALLAGKEAVIVEFTLDKVLEPGMVDSRELGLVISRIGLSPK